MATACSGGSGGGGNDGVSWICGPRNCGGGGGDGGLVCLPLGLRTIVSSKRQGRLTAFVVQDLKELVAAVMKSLRGDGVVSSLRRYLKERCGAICDGEGVNEGPAAPRCWRVELSP